LTGQGKRDDEMLEVLARGLIGDISRSQNGSTKELMLAIALSGGGGDGGGEAFRALMPFVLQHKTW
jgi:hypothetical protein